jgi:polyisoprenoid-binding protein YceI
MKKNILAILLLSLTFFEFSIHKGKYFTNTGKVSFFSTTPFENIAALNSKVTSFLDTDEGSVVFSILIKDFVFDKSLMQEHFNENYMESDKYPRSTFKGKVVNLTEVKFNENGKYNTIIQGEFTIHNVTRMIKVNGTMEVKDGKIFAKAKFPVRIEDYKIKVPKVVFQNIAEIVEVTVDMIYDPYNK